MSRQELADAVNAYLWKHDIGRSSVDANYVGKLERGHHRWPQATYREAFRAVLGAATDAEIGFHVLRRSRTQAARRTDAAVPRPRPSSDIERAGGTADLVGAHGDASGADLDAGTPLAIVNPYPWARLATALRHPERTDERVVEDLADETTALFRQEEHLPSRRLRGSVQSRVAQLESLCRGAPSRLERRLLTVLGETLALAGWIAWDRQEVREAGLLYERGAEAARQAGDGPLLACVLGLRSYAAEADGDLDEARELLVQAQGYARSKRSAATTAWLAARDAEVSAALGAETEALRAVDRAVVAFDFARPHRERSWTGFLTPSRLGSLVVSTYARLDRPELDAATEAVVESLPRGESKVAAMVLADVALAKIQCGRLGEGVDFAHRALDEALTHESRLATHRLQAVHRLIRSQLDDPMLARLDDRLTGFRAVALHPTDAVAVS